MGICHSDKKKNFGLTSKLDKKLASILDKQYAVDEYDPSNYTKNLNEITQNVIENSVIVKENRSTSVLKNNGKSPKVKKRLNRKKKNPEKTKNHENKNEINEKPIILKEVPKKKKKVIENIKNEKIENSPLLTGNYYELLDNLDKSNNLVSQNLDYDMMNEEFLELKEYVDKKLELLNKKEHQLNLLKEGLETHYSKETASNLDVNIISKKIDKKLKKVSSKTENLNNLNDQLYKFMSNTQSKANSLTKEGVQKALDNITKEDTDIYQYQKTLTSKGSIISPNPKFLQKNMRKNSNYFSPCPLFPRKDLSHPSPLFFKDTNTFIDGINSGMLKSKVEKKIEEIDQDNQKLEFLTSRLKTLDKEGNKDIEILLGQVEEKIFNKFKKVELDDLEKGLDDSQGLVVWSDKE